MRRALTSRAVLAALGAAALVGCASAAPPPGGPEDKNPPRLLRVSPDTNAVGFSDRVASFYFDETINDRGTGAQSVDAHFLVSPSDGAPRVSWHRSRIDVRPRNGFRPNTAYTITMRAGLSDLRTNAMKTGATVTFSTGPTIPPYRIRGTAFDWVAAAPAARALIEAITPDSLVYLAESDSAGRFAVGPLPAGSYLVRAITDQNGNRALDRTEAFDTVRVTLPPEPTLELRMILRDTLPARLLTVTVTDSVTLKVEFDRYLAAGAAPPVTAFTLRAPDSTDVPIVRVTSAREEAQAAQAARDSAAARDTSSRARAAAANAAAPAGRAAADTARRTPSQPTPFNSVTIRLARPLAPNTSYRLRVTGVAGLSGRSAASERAFTTPRAAAPRSASDSARAGGRTPATPPAR